MPIPMSPPPCLPTRRSRTSSCFYERVSLAAFMGDSDFVIQRTIRRYAKLARQCLDGSVNTLHKRIGAEHGMFLYEEKSESLPAPSFVHQIYPGAWMRHTAQACHSDRNSARAVAHRITKLFAFGGGELAGTLDDVMEASTPILRTATPPTVQFILASITLSTAELSSLLKSAMTPIRIASSVQVGGS